MQGGAFIKTSATPTEVCLLAALSLTCENVPIHVRKHRCAGEFSTSVNDFCTFLIQGSTFVMKTHNPVYLAAVGK